MLHHALHGARDGIGTAAGECITGVGGEQPDLPRRHMQPSGAGLQGAQHDAVARQDEPAQKIPLRIHTFHRDRRAHHHQHQRACRALCQHVVACTDHGHPAV
ncbi:hypothetical protein D3C71_1758370 [compost metagenome]